MSIIESGSFEFALKLYKTLSSPQNNLVVSPFSLTSALSMTLYGARDKTGEELSKGLFGSAIAVDKYKSLAQEFNALIEKSVKSNSQVLATANFLYSHKGYPIEPEYQQTLEKYFLAKSQVLDLVDNPDIAINTINNDISDATKGKIKELISEIDPLTRLILTNESISE